MGCQTKLPAISPPSPPSVRLSLPPSVAPCLPACLAPSSCFVPALLPLPALSLAHGRCYGRLGVPAPASVSGLRRTSTRRPLKKSSTMPSRPSRQQSSQRIGASVGATFCFADLITAACRVCLTSSTAAIATATTTATRPAEALAAAKEALASERFVVGVQERFGDSVALFGPCPPRPPWPV